MSTGIKRLSMIAILIAGSLGGHAASAFSFTDLAGVGGSNSSANAINNLGQVVGRSDTGYRTPTLWDGMTTTALMGVGEARSISDSGLIAGHIFFAGEGRTGVVWSTADLGNFPLTLATEDAINCPGPGSDCPYNSDAFAINNSGKTVGWSAGGWNSDEAGGGSITRWNGAAANWLETTPTPLGLGGSANAINSMDHIAGWTGSVDAKQAFFWNGSGASALSTLGGDYSEARALNDANQVVGWAMLSGNSSAHAVLWADSGVTDLGALGGVSSSANAINQAGQAVGYFEDAHGVRHAALWRSGIGKDLNSFLDQSVVDAGWVLTEANGINDHGWIVGNASNALLGVSHGFILAVPEPETYPLFLTGLLVITVAGRRRKAASAGTAQ